MPYDVYLKDRIAERDSLNWLVCHWGGNYFGFLNAGEGRNGYALCYYPWPEDEPIRNYAEVFAPDPVGYLKMQWELRLLDGGDPQAIYSDSGPFQTFIINRGNGQALDYFVENGNLRVILSDLDESNHTMLWEIIRDGPQRFRIENVGYREQEQGHKQLDLY